MSRRSADGGGSAVVRGGRRVAEAAPHSGGRRHAAEEVRQGLAGAARMPITRRELQALRHAAAGAPVAETAAALHLAPGTIRNYLNPGIRRLGARNKTDAVRAARETGWLLVPRPSGHGSEGAGSRGHDEP
ncbi:LuxR family transcriptional regulator [Streptomyces sp. RKND-216]|uniref:response regulator transcription factor n=1 Tax=Streptomyces sp. RKND-216 TaxID=2562581 RepID=UPI00109E120F|nr:helix-turn-helix transcriptional regulator [Streptomyces sp. RKND-216]THA23588.1 LuxR family transcriptional regulator [Streptomyces sp. RKND-216]